jgi:hypothetical protein
LIEAMDEEIYTIENNDTWKLIRKTIGVK